MTSKSKAQLEKSRLTVKKGKKLISVGDQCTESLHIVMRVFSAARRWITPLGNYEQYFSS